MAEYEIFREQLAIKHPSYGYALWEPSPTNPNRPVQIGDVGFIREGRFYRLFSALLSTDDPSQELGVPENHEPLVPTLSDHVATVSLARNNYCSAGVVAGSDPGYHSSPDDFPQVLFRNLTTRAAAVLSLPVMARHENTLIRNVFGRWMVKKIDTWFAFARNLGLVDHMEEIILVTGCDLTKSWANVAFLGEADAQVSFGVKVEGPNISINFQYSPERARGAILHHGPEGTNLPENQCVFIRGFRVAPSLWILPKRLKAAAGPSSDPGGYDSDSYMELTLIPAATKFRDPLHLLSDYIAEQASDCDKILVHDDDLLMIDGIGHDTLLETLESDVMVDLFRKSDIKIHKLGRDSILTESESGPNADTSNVKVATLSMTSQDWSSDVVPGQISDSKSPPVGTSVSLPGHYKSASPKSSSLPRSPNHNDVLSWTSQDPRQSQLFSPWGVVYRFQTEINPQGQSITTVWRAIRAGREDQVARLEWGPTGGLGRAVIGKNHLPMADLVRRDPRMPNSRVFEGPDGFQYRWRPSTTSQDIVLQDPNNNVIAFVRPTRPTRYQGVGDVYAELHFIRSAGTGAMIHPPLMDTVTVTAMLYRFASAFNL